MIRLPIIATPPTAPAGDFMVDGDDNEMVDGDGNNMVFEA